MAYVKIPKDLGKIKTKVAFNLTKRQLIGFGCAAALGLPTYWFTKDSVGVDVATVLMMVVVAPILYFALYEKDGLPLESYIKFIYLHKFHHSTIRFFRKKCKRGGVKNGTETKTA